MSHHKNRIRNKSSKPSALSSPLKKLPSKKSARPKKEVADLHIDLRSDRRDYDSIIELAKRKFTNASPSKMPAGVVKVPA